MEGREAKQEEHNQMQRMKEKIKFKKKGKEESAHQPPLFQVLLNRYMFTIIIH